MIKNAQKRSMDPAQQKLRQAKAVWNKEVSTFLNDVIHLKKMMNGWPSKYYKERSKITMPIPSNPSTILSSLSNKFQELAQQGDTIAQQQAQYSQTRRKPRPQQAVETLNKLEEKYGPTETPIPPPLTPTAPPTGTDLTKQLVSSFEIKYELVAEGSNPFSRFLARIKAPQAGFGQKAQLRRMRMDLLKAALKCYRALGRLQVNVSKSSKESVNIAYKEMQAAWNEWSLVSRNFNQYANTLPGASTVRSDEMREEAYSPEKEEAELMVQNKPWEKQELIRRIVGDYRSYAHLYEQEAAGSSLQQISDTINKIITVPKAQKLLLATELEQNYQQAINSLNQTLGTNGTTLKEITQQLSKKKKPESSTTSQRPLKGSQPPLSDVEPATDLEVVAQAFLKKWIGKTRHQLLPGRSSGTRLQIFELAADARKNIDSVMNLLEKGLDVNTLGTKISEVTRQINTLRSLMRSLHNTEKPPAKGTSPLEGLF